MLGQVDSQLVGIAFILILVVIMVIKPFRELFIWFLKDIVLPAMTWLCRYLGLYFLKVIKNVIYSHFEIIKNMSYPRNVIFVSLENQRKNRDKAMNQKGKS